MVTQGDGNATGRADLSDEQRRKILDELVSIKAALAMIESRLYTIEEQLAHSRKE